LSRGIARLHDRTLGTCTHPSHSSPRLNMGGKIITASSDVNVNSRGVARLGDTVLTDCGHTSTIITASGTVTSTLGRGQQAARLADKVGNGPYNAVIITASVDTFTS